MRPQELVPLGEWGFKSPLPHHFFNAPMFIGVFVTQIAKKLTSS